MDDIPAAARHPAFAPLVARRRRLSAAVLVCVVLSYYGFVLVAAFAPALVARPALGTIPWGIVLGLATILTAIGLTGFYAWRANATIDPLVARIAADCGPGE